VSHAQPLAGSTILAVLLSLSVTSAGQQGSAPVQPSNTTVAGELLIEPATLINLGFEWFIQGDANRNAAVSVSYRK
jgi:hypothetical protein